MPAVRHGGILRAPWIARATPWHPGRCLPMKQSGAGLAGRGGRQVVLGVRSDEDLDVLGVGHAPRPSDVKRLSAKA